MALSPFHEAQLIRIKKAEWLEGYIQARIKSLTRQNIASAWRGAGLVPFDRKKALRYLPNERTNDGHIAKTPPCSPPNKAFTPVYLNSSSPELAALRNANNFFQERIEVLETPLRSHFRELAARTERHSTRNIIFEHENSNLRSLLNKRREVTKGKRSVIKGKFRLSREELRDGVLEAEKVTLEGSRKKGKKSPNQAKALSGSDIEDADAPEEELEKELQDCIFVAVK